MMPLMRRRRRRGAEAEEDVVLQAEVRGRAGEDEERGVEWGEEGEGRDDGGDQLDQGQISEDHPERQADVDLI
ncbi:hypothetical protein MLD38_026144 [Melastoma candidum]|uniref:Uncharacterized protein n=1 Tax=Melastoma candidum TaxID=119954 RepID=A0ACB9P0I3_9MYRT|nr:hypothetical protein MLD38_026144 [Melastoma candidum]